MWELSNIINLIMIKLFKNMIHNLLFRSDIQINGNRSHDIQTKDENQLIENVILNGELGFMEDYINAKWTCKNLKTLFEKLMTVEASGKIKSWTTKLFEIMKTSFSWIFYFTNSQSIKKSKDVIDIHYNLGNEFYENLLGPSMQYSCGYWNPTTENSDKLTLTTAQGQKMNLIAEKLKLEPRHRVLDIGCGFGTLAYHLSTYCSQVVGVTLSEEQYKWATKNFKKEIKEGKLVFICSDYRLLGDLGKFDRVVSVGFLEHVGVRNLTTFCDIVDKFLIDDGIACIHTIGKENSSGQLSPFIQKYIFPGGELPTPNDICVNFLNKFRLEDWHNFGKDYSLTLDSWYRNFLHFPFSDDKMNRIWELYLSSCSAAFSTRKIQLWQIIFTKNSSTIEYRSVR